MMVAKVKGRNTTATVKAIEVRGLTQAATAAFLGIDQPKVSRLLRNRLSEFSVSRLMRFIALLGRDVEIVIHAAREDAPGQKGHLRVVATTTGMDGLRATPRDKPGQHQCSQRSARDCRKVVGAIIRRASGFTTGSSPPHPA